MLCVFSTRPPYSEAVAYIFLKSAAELMSNEQWNLERLADYLKTALFHRKETSAWIACFGWTIMFATGTPYGYTSQTAPSPESGGRIWPRANDLKICVRIVHIALCLPATEIVELIIFPRPRCLLLDIVKDFDPTETNKAWVGFGSMLPYGICCSSALHLRIANMTSRQSGEFRTKILK